MSVSWATTGKIVVGVPSSSELELTAVNDLEMAAASFTVKRTHEA